MTAGAGVRGRIDSIDLLRGLVMVIMALDHTREFVHSGALQFDPLNLERTTPLLFLTRWITHYCAPIFVFLAGMSAYLLKARGRSTGELSRFLWTRGFWLIVLEFTAVRALVWFNLDYTFAGLAQVIWVIGVSMVALAALVFLPLPAIAAIAFAMMLGHNAFDGVRVPPWGGGSSTAPGAWASLWIVLHQGGMLPLWNGAFVWVLYPLIPWIGVMAAGYVAGRIYDHEPDTRQRLLIRCGLMAIGAFVLLRVGNVYGDPQHWQPQATLVNSALSFVNTSKYPPSLLFLLMTLGPALLLLALLDSRPLRGAAARAFVTFGRVPMFFYLLQWIGAHGAGVLLTYAAGKQAGYLFQNPPEFFTLAPPDAGFSLATAYAAWITIVAIAYVLCQWYAGVKARRRDWWLSYL